MTRSGDCADSGAIESFKYFLFSTRVTRGFLADLPWRLVDGGDDSSVGKIFFVDVNSIILADDCLDSLAEGADCFTVVFVLKEQN